MDHRRLIGVVIIGTLLLGVVTSCGAPGGSGGLPGVGPLAISLPAAGAAVVNPAEGDEFETIRQAADAYVNSDKPLYMNAQELYNAIMTGIGLTDYQVDWYDPETYTRGPFIVDVRTAPPEMPDLYLTGHIPGSVNVGWQQLTQFKNIKNLPKERQIVIVSTTGEIGAQVTAVLNLLGYNAINLQWGMNSWTKNPDVVIGNYEKARDTVSNWGDDYATGATPGPSETYAFPVVNNTEAGDKATVLMAAANAYLSSGTKRFDMKASDLYQALNFNPQTAAQIFLSTFFTGSATGNPYSTPFVLDIRNTSTFKQGHLANALNVFWKEVFKTENLSRLPADRQILVYGDNGQESSVVTAMLNLLGYDAQNLRWGITADQFAPARDQENYPFVTGFGPFNPCPT